MKKKLKKIYSIIFIILNKLINHNIKIKKTFVFLSKFNVKKSNELRLNNSCVERSSISIEGKNNIIEIQGFLSNSKINIWGTNNQITIHPSVKINNSTIVLRGSNCKIEIGKGSTFGGIHMVCMGGNNYIKVGENCMFAENIDLWATDSHPIFNIENELINPSKPVIIGDYVWVGAKCSILKGVSIGSGSIIGMSSIVTKNVDEKTLNVGNPLRCIKNNIRWKREFINSN